MMWLCVGGAAVLAFAWFDWERRERRAMRELREGWGGVGHTAVTGAGASYAEPVRRPASIRELTTQPPRRGRLTLWEEIEFERTRQQIANLPEIQIEEWLT
jgi:hypothetical protein